MRIKYVGTKVMKKDVVAGTGLIWAGHGDIQDVEDPAKAVLLLRTPEIFQAVDGDAPAIQPLPEIRKGVVIDPSLIGQPEPTPPATTMPLGGASGPDAVETFDPDAPPVVGSFEEALAEADRPKTAAEQDQVIAEAKAELYERAKKIGFVPKDVWGVSRLAKEVAAAEELHKTSQAATK